MAGVVRTGVIMFAAQPGAGAGAGRHVVVEVDSLTGPSASLEALVGCGEEPGLRGTGYTYAA